MMSPGGASANSTSTTRHNNLRPGTTNSLPSPTGLSRRTVDDYKRENVNQCATAAIYGGWYSNPPPGQGPQQEKVPWDARREAHSNVYEGEVDQRPKHVLNNTSGIMSEFHVESPPKPKVSLSPRGGSTKPHSASAKTSETSHGGKTACASASGGGGLSQSAVEGGPSEVQTVDAMLSNLQSFLRYTKTNGVK